MAKKIREPVIIEAFSPLKAAEHHGRGDHRRAPAPPSSGMRCAQPSAAISFEPAICAGASA